MRSPWLLALALVGCDDAPPPALPDADNAVDLSLRLDAEVDATPRDLGGPDLSVDLGAPDAIADLGAPDAAPPPVVTAEVRLEVDLADLPTTLAGGPLLGEGQSIELGVPPLPPELAALDRVGIWLEAGIWRVEDGLVELDVGGGPLPALFPGDARGGGAFLTRRDLGDTPGASGGPTILTVPTDGLERVRLTARGGVLHPRGARIVDPRHTPMPRRLGGGPPPPIVELAPCGEGCDDGAAITAAIAQAPPGELWVQLAAGRYHLRTPVTIRRDELALTGAGRETVLFWDPEAEGSPAAILVQGAGPTGPAVPFTRDATESRALRRVPPEGWPAARWLRYRADDFGHIPRNCVNGRDQEQYTRHVDQLVAVLEPFADGRVVVDRALHLEIPPEANPRVEPVALVSRIAIGRLHLLANCPAALVNEGFERPDCANPAVIEDDGIRLQWTAAALVYDVSAQGFGKYAINVNHAVGTRLRGNQMDHPSDYGGSGHGYGVHLIYASRTVVADQQVEHARHGVVVDFGSSDSQVLDGAFRDMNQALVDVHGEASRDTLVRGNLLEGSPLGVIVGGGGNEAHCNDGPRHHIQHNVMRGITNSGVTVFDETRQVFVRHNDLTGTLFGLTVAFESGDVFAERNVFAGSRIPVQVAGAGPVIVRGNLFADVCTPEEAVRLLNGEAEVADDNSYCPSP